LMNRQAKREVVDRPHGLLTEARMLEFAAYYGATMSPEAAREATEHMYRTIGNPSTVMHQHIEQQRRAAVGG
jgi:hypothetical protein